MVDEVWSSSSMPAGLSIPINDLARGRMIHFDYCGASSLWDTVTTTSVALSTSITVMPLYEYPLREEGWLCVSNCSRYWG
jgi:hypothetical protein